MDNDSGNYTCWTDITTPATITLHVIDKTGEHRLPMLNSDGSIVTQDSWIIVILLLMIMLPNYMNSYGEQSKSCPEEVSNKLFSSISLSTNKNDNMLMCPSKNPDQTIKGMVD